MKQADPSLRRGRAGHPSRPRVLVTGATGFIGRHLVRGLLERGYSVRALVRDEARAAARLPSRVQVVRGDVTDVESLRAAMGGIRVVFHAAAAVRPWGRWRPFQAATVTGTENAVRAAGEAGVERFVQFSTVAVYDDKYLAAGPVRETTPLTRGSWTGAFGFYGRSKMLAERAALRIGAANGLGVTVLRPAWVYGPYDESILPYVRAYLTTPFAPWLDGSDPLMPFVYVADVVEAAILAAGAPRSAGRAYNIAATPYPLRDFLWELCDGLGGRMPYFRVPRRWAMAAALAAETAALPLSAWLPPPITPAAVTLLERGVEVDCSRAKRELGWTPCTSPEEGLEATVAWLRAEGGRRSRSSAAAGRARRALGRFLGGGRARGVVAAATK